MTVMNLHPAMMMYMLYIILDHHLKGHAYICNHESISVQYIVDKNICK